LERVKLQVSQKEATIKLLNKQIDDKENADSEQEKG